MQNIAGTYGGDPQTYSANYGNLMMFGAVVAGFLPRGAVLKPEEAWNIDTKQDDGRPGTGKVLAYEPSNFANGNSCTTSTSGTDFAGTYALTRTSAACSLQFPTAF